MNESGEGPSVQKNPIGFKPLMLPVKWEMTPKFVNDKPCEKAHVCTAAREDRGWGGRATNFLLAL